jgi:hypothetical protein
MTEETKQKLRDAGREDLVKTYDLLQSGYAGVNQRGTIVDRREVPAAIPIQQNSMFDTPAPKELPPINNGSLAGKFPREIHYDVPFEVTKNQYTVIMRDFAQIVAGRVHNGRYYIKLWVMSFKEKLQKALTENL